MRVKLSCLLLVLMFAVGMGMVSCSPGDSDGEKIQKKYEEWHDRNVEFFEAQEALRNADGSPYYERLVPSWAPGVYSLIRWENDRSLTAGNLQPLDNSTVKAAYELRNLDGTVLDSSDSFVTRPLSTVVGFWSALTSMRVGDKVSLVVPYQAGYGAYASGSVLPYTTLVFSIELKEIIAYEIKP